MILKYNLYYFLIYFFKWKFFGPETCTDSYYFVFNFYQINKYGKIQTLVCLVIKVLIVD